MIRAVTFDKQLLKSEDFAHQVNQFYQGKMGVSKGCEISTDVDGNIVITDGYFSVYGRLLRNLGNTIVEVPAVASGTLYSFLVFEIDLSQENTIDLFNQGTFKILSNAIAYPTLTQEDLDNGGTIYQLEFCRFENTVAGIVNLVDIRTILSLQMYVLDDDFVAHKAESAAKHITESGNNLNGKYIKFDDGTMICEYNTTEFMMVSSGATATGAKAFPVTFSDLPSVVITPTFDMGAGFLVGTVRLVSTTAVDFTLYNGHPTINLDLGLQVIAIGRWYNIGMG